MEIRKKKNKNIKEFGVFPRSLAAEFVGMPPKPAKSFIPNWYKKASRYVDNSNEFIVGRNGDTNNGVKGCTSFIDILTFGYMISTHCDIMIEMEPDGRLTMFWTSDLEPASLRSESIYSQIPSPPGFGPFEFAIELNYGFLLPKGYSAIICQPFNNFEINTYLSAGIIDADSLMQPGGIPFAVKEGFTGMIPAGTPIAQVLPFKRDNWITKAIGDPFKRNQSSIPRNYFKGYYKKNIWKKKEFN